MTPAASMNAIDIIPSYPLKHGISKASSIEFRTGMSSYRNHSESVEKLDMEATFDPDMPPAEFRAVIKNQFPFFKTKDESKPL